MKSGSQSQRNIWPYLNRDELLHSQVSWGSWRVIHLNPILPQIEDRLFSWSCVSGIHKHTHTHKHQSLVRPHEQTQSVNKLWPDMPQKAWIHSSANTHIHTVTLGSGVSFEAKSHWSSPISLPLLSLFHSLSHFISSSCLHTTDLSTSSFALHFSSHLLPSRSCLKSAAGASEATEITAISPSLCLSCPYILHF